MILSHPCCWGDKSSSLGRKKLTNAPSKLIHFSLGDFPFGPDGFTSELDNRLIASHASIGFAGRLYGRANRDPYSFHFFRFWKMVTHLDAAA